MAGGRIYVGYYRRYNRKVVYVISLVTDADTVEESVIWITYPFADAHPMNRGSVDHQQKKSFFSERTRRGGEYMPTAETSTKVNNLTTNGTPAIKQTLRFSIKCMS